MALLPVLLLAAALAEDCSDGSCGRKAPGVLLMQTKPGSLLAKGGQPDVSAVLAEMQVLKEQMATMLGAVQTVQAKVEKCCSCGLNKGGFSRDNTGLCAAFGDPHFITFDGAQTTSVGDMVQWLVKTDSIHIQDLARGSEGALLGFAASGPFLSDHRLVVSKDQLHGPLKVSWDGVEILTQSVDEFHIEDTIRAYRRTAWDADVFDDRILSIRTRMTFNVGDFEDRFKNLIDDILLFVLPGNLHVTVTAVDYMSLVISMPAVPGQTGYCGNFNDDPDDDAEPVVPSWDRPIGSDLEQVAPPQVIFDNETVLALLGSASGSEDLGTKLKRIKECPDTLLRKAEEACSGLTSAFHKFCVFDVCLTKDLAAAKSVGSAVVLQHENAIGAPVFMGHGRCVDVKGRSFRSHATKLRTDTACQQVLRSLSNQDGVMGAQLKRGGFCEVLTAQTVDPTRAAIPGGWGIPGPSKQDDVYISMAPKGEAQAVVESEPGDAEGLIADTTDEAAYNCWQLN